MNAIDDLDRLAQSPQFQQHLTGVLQEICAVDTSARPNVDELRDSEERVFDVLERELRQYQVPSLRIERRAIDPAIADHAFFSKLYYTAAPHRPAGLDVKETYKDRHNLLVFVDGDDRRAGGVDQAVNAHIDVVKPYIAPRLEGDVLFGRGACDDKGCVVAIMGAIKLVGEYLRSKGKKLNRSLVGMLVIEEEMGGNGSLSLAIDRGLRREYDSLMVLECTENRVHPGNRGALWYKIILQREHAWMNLLEASAFVIGELEAEGRAIKAESRHELFPHRPTQTCHGIIGSYGEHPSRINGRVYFVIRFPGGRPADAQNLVRDVIESALAEYVGLYGDKTKVLDAEGKPKVHHHYDLQTTADGFVVQVHGSTGHMGSILENDGAITKMATMVRALARSRKALDRLGGSAMQLALVDQVDDAKLVMEGGQGFLPIHSMPEIMSRISDAARRGVAAYARLLGRQEESTAGAAVVSFEKLHNAAFAGRCDSPDMQHAIEAAKLTGLWRDEPVRGWDVSCDARIFACEYADLPVLTCGPGNLAWAHSDREQVDLREVARFARFLAYFILKQTNSLDI